MVRTRIAPAPSGFLHLGTAKTAMYNWLLAKKDGGAFVLRLEDTDASRTDESYVEGMCEGFRWLGILWDEGPEFGGEAARGEHGPYRQSLRRDQHREAAFQLLASGKAYKCYATKEEIDAFRTDHPHQPYVSPWRDASPEKVAEMGEAPHALRFRVPEGETVLDDLIQGEVRWQNSEYDDFVILKPNGDPVFHLAVVVDDAAMQISHVIRGDDHLTNTPRHLWLFDALGYARPQYAHHPLVHDEHGKKYSKRLHGANVLDWRDDGYLPETIINYIALLGWTSEEENREFFSLDELIEHFSIERLGRSAAKFDRKKLDWLNGQHIRRLPIDELRDRLVAILDAEGFDSAAKSTEWLTQMATICQEKLPTLKHVVAMTDFFFRAVTDYDEKGVRKQWRKEDSLERMGQAQATMAAIKDWSHDGLHAAFSALSEESGKKLGLYVNPVRLALTGKPVGPGFFELAELMGKDTALARMNQAMAFMQNLGEETA